MSYSTRAYDNAQNQPVIVVVAEGAFDVSRALHTLSGRGPAAFPMIQAAVRLRRQVARHNGGQRALQLLTAHGGPDFADEDEWPWHTLRRYIEHNHPFQDGPVECYELTCPDICHTLPPWAFCWARKDPEQQCWPPGAGTWRIRPEETAVGGDEDGPNIISWLHVQVFDEDKQDWIDWDWSRE